MKKLLWATKKQFKWYTMKYCGDRIVYPFQVELLRRGFNNVPFKGCPLICVDPKGIKDYEVVDIRELGYNVDRWQDVFYNIKPKPKKVSKFHGPLARWIRKTWLPH